MANSVNTSINPMGRQNITFSVGIPNVIMQLLDGTVIKRMLTLEVVDDYDKLDKTSQNIVIAKVAKVALATLIVALAVSFITVEVVWAVPLCVLITAGLSFSFLTAPEYSSNHLVIDEAKKSAVKERGRRDMCQQTEPPNQRITRSKSRLTT